MSARPVSRHHFTSTSSASSANSYSSSDSESPRLSYSMDSPPIASVAVLRCMRCAKSVEMTTTDDAASVGMISCGYNIYYCKSCAKATGYK